MGRKYANILETVGNTPVVRIGKLAPAGVNLFVKIEAFNPLGSVKDRLALGVIEDAERTGKLKPGQTVIEATSGNTGIGLAMVCAAKGYPLVVTMAETFSVERRKLMRFLGAKVILTPAAERGLGMVNKAIELAQTHGWFLTRQFENEANPDMHSRTTAREIINDFKGEKLDYWVTGFGTGGTLKGVARVLAKEIPDTKIVVCEPADAPMLTSGSKQERNPDGSPAAPNAVFKPHPMQGWSPDFIPKLTGDAVDMKVIERLLTIAGPEAMKCSKELATKEGIFVGITAGATFAGALKVAADAPKGANILCMLPDTGERYLSTPLFADIPADMTEEEWDIARSTPSVRFYAPSPAPPPAPPNEHLKEASAPVCSIKPPAQVSALPAGTPEAQAFVTRALEDPQNPVVLFALEWCEFSWAARKLFKAYGVPFNSVDIDSVQYQKDDFGGQIRAAVSARTGFKTIPQ